MKIILVGGPRHGDVVVTESNHTEFHCLVESDFPIHLGVVQEKPMYPIKPLREDIYKIFIGVFIDGMQAFYYEGRTE